MTIKYIIGHWTAGNNYPSEYDKKHYQLLIDGAGKPYNGTAAGKAAATGGMNSITYNIACCGGLEKTPVTAVQMEAFCKNAAVILKKYNLSAENFYTHAEIGEMVKNYQNAKSGKGLNGADCSGRLITELLPWNNYLFQNAGKIDLKKLPVKGITQAMSAKQSGYYLRNKIKWYYLKLS